MKDNDKLSAYNCSPWINFAEEDLLSAKTLLKEKIYNQVCFHSQQAAEKMLKAFLKSRCIMPPKVHNLLELLEMCKGENAGFKKIQEECEYLSKFYLSVRYPDALPGFLPEGLPVLQDAKKAVESAKDIMNFVKERMKKLNRIDKKFNDLKFEGKKAFIAFITSGDPSLNKTEEIVKALERASVDILELGVPFSDPLADGQTIQLASQRALSKGVNLKKIFTLVESIRRESELPIALMTYYNPVLSYGIEKFTVDCQDNGVDGVIVPDLPIEEAKELYGELKKRAVCFIPFISPTSTVERKIKTTSMADGFIYYVSLTGVTGARKKMDASLVKDLRETKKITKDKPLAVGFGISTVEQVKEIKPYCDGVIVGSAIVKIIEENQTSGNLAQKVETFVGQLTKAVHQ